MASPSDPFYLTDLFLGDHTNPARATDRIRPVPVRSGNQIASDNLNYANDPSGDPGDSACTMPSTNAQMTTAQISDNWEKLAKTLGLNEQCTQTARETLVNLTPTSSGFWNNISGGSSVDKTYLDNQMQAKGCGSFSTNLNSVYNQMSSLKCQYTKMIATNSTDVKNNANVTVRIIQPSAEAAAEIKEILRDYDDHIRSYDLTRPTPAEFIGMSLEMVNVFLSTHERGRAELIRSKNAFQTENPIIASISNSTINAVSKATTTTSTIAEFDSTSSASVKTSIKNAATATAISHIEQSLGLGALPPNARNFVQSQVNDITEQRTNQILSQITQNTVRDRSGVGTVIEITGRVSGSTIIAMAESTVDAKVHSSMKSAISIGEEIASNIVTALDSEHLLITQSDGVGDAIQGVLNAASERARYRKEENQSFWGGFFTTTSVIIIVFIIVGGYFGYKYLQARTVGGMKYGRR
jgi:hypothetical protein